MRISFQEELDQLERSLHGESELVLRSLRGAVEAVCAQDVELADEVIAFDDDVDAQYFEIEQGIELLLARQTPVASDLRLVLAMLKDNLHLERMGDLCVTIAKLTKLTKGLPPDETLLDGFRGRPKADVDALVDAIVAFSRMAAQLGERLVEAEINPVFVLPRGQGVRAADGVVVLA